MRVLILGGTKFIGPCVVHSLHTAGAEVAVFHRGQSQPERHQNIFAHVHQIIGDRNELETYQAKFAAFRPEVVLDMRPLGNADSQRVMQLFAGLARRAVMISSIDVYRNYDVLRGKEPGLSDPAPLLEDSPLRSQLYPYLEPEAAPDSFTHVYEKILAERAYLSHPELPGTVLRLPFVYGPGDYQHRLHPYLKRMDDGRLAILLSEENASWQASRCYVENVGHAVALAVLNDQAANRTYNVAEPVVEADVEPTSPTVLETASEWVNAPGSGSELEWVRQIARAAGWQGNIALVPEATLPPSLRSESDYHAHLTISTNRIRLELGYTEIITQDEALRETIAWERANPPAQTLPDAFDYAAEDKVLAMKGAMG